MEAVQFGDLAAETVGAIVVCEFCVSGPIVSTLVVVFCSRARSFTFRFHTDLFNIVLQLNKNKYQK